MQQSNTSTSNHATRHTHSQDTTATHPSGKLVNYKRLACYEHCPGTFGYTFVLFIFAVCFLVLPHMSYLRRNSQFVWRMALWKLNQYPDRTVHALRIQSLKCNKQSSVYSVIKHLRVHVRNLCYMPAKNLVSYLRGRNRGKINNSDLKRYVKTDLSSLI